MIAIARSIGKFHVTTRGGCQNLIIFVVKKKKKEHNLPV
jgi:hypothetical protein